MKTILIIAMILGLAPWAQASVIADTFSCQISLKNLTTKETVEFSSQAVAARLTQQGPIDHGDLTGGFFDISMQHSKGASLNITVDLNTNYRFASKVQSGLTMVRQQVCESATIEICEDGDCSSMSSTCHTGLTSPFDPINGWPVTTEHQGIPVFNEKLLGKNTMTLYSAVTQQHYELSSQCRFSGTLH